MLPPQYRPLILLTAASGADYALFAWSAGLTGMGIMVILFDAWPGLAVFLLSWLYGRRLDPRTGPLVGCCCLGAVLAAASGHGGFGGLWVELTATPAGLAPALLGVAATSLAVCAFRFGTLFAMEPRIVELAAGSGSEGSLDRLRVVLAFAAGNLVSTPLILGLGLVLGGAAPGFGAGLFMFAGGGLLAAEAVLWQTTNARSGNPAVNALGCFTPLLALGLLAVFGLAGEGPGAGWPGARWSSRPAIWGFKSVVHPSAG